MRLAAPALAALALAAAGCGGGTARPSGDPGAFAVQVVRLIVHNEYRRAWRDLDPVDQQVAPLREYVGCETRSPVTTVPLALRVVRVHDESVGLGNGSFVQSKAVDVRIRFTGGTVVHTVHVVASGGKWTWILPSWRYRDYHANTCPGAATPTTVA